MDDRYALLKCLGDPGGYARVFEAWDTQEAKRVAIKKFNKFSKFHEQMAKNEAAAMTQINHQNVLKVLHQGRGKFVSNPDGHESKWIYLVLELAQDRTVFDFIVESGAFPEHVAAFYTKSLVEGLKAIHEQGLCHRDIKCENLLLDDQFNLKIGDFGCAARLRGLESKVGTSGQIAPEIEELEEGRTYDGDRVDIFNTGIVVFCLVFGRMPFGRATTQDAFFKLIADGKEEAFWTLHEDDELNVSKVSDACKNLIWQLLQRQPSSRPTLEEILESEWLQSTEFASKPEIMSQLENRLDYLLLVDGE